MRELEFTDVYLNNIVHQSETTRYFPQDRDIYTVKEGESVDTVIEKLLDDRLEK